MINTLLYNTAALKYMFHCFPVGFVNSLFYNLIMNNQR